MATRPATPCALLVLLATGCVTAVAPKQGPVTKGVSRNHTSSRFAPDLSFRAYSSRAASSVQSCAHTGTTLLASRRPVRLVAGRPAMQSRAEIIPGGSSSPSARLVALCYLILGSTALYALTTTLMKNPIFPFKTESLQWCRSWLYTTIVDYYGACLALCAVILSSEPKWVGIGWSLGCCFFGAPVCCAWVVLRVLRHGSLRLSTRS